MVLSQNRIKIAIILIKRWLPVKTIYNERYQRLITALIKIRKGHSLTQQQVADGLSKPQSYIAKIEKFERKLDVLEFVDLCEVIGANRVEVLKEVDKISMND